MEGLRVGAAWTAVIPFMTTSVTLPLLPCRIRCALLWGIWLYPSFAVNVAFKKVLTVKVDVQ